MVADKTREGSPVVSKPFPMLLHHYAKSARPGKIAVTLKPMSRFDNPLVFRMPYAHQYIKCYDWLRYLITLSLAVP